MRVKRPPLFGTIPTCENPGATLSGIKPGLPRWQVSNLTTPPWPLRKELMMVKGVGRFGKGMEREKELEKVRRRVANWVKGKGRNRQDGEDDRNFRPPLMMKSWGGAL
ncbi:hypothetical protein PR048_021621 [Dryococelus australis]|uniref:Uncharacterized protein n=1 Tax=Dryococelus australis TaxID=614101 RepID=A0ABQ9GYQ6_9NEOP|nr:hypothetical protein PR048_021620 [Dryococelus australis]KAJ8877168.1 hypothetical protein PR048_021621 [Dryococelus australis]